MTKDTNTHEKTSLRAVQSVKYYFTCSCGCGQVSEEIGKEYIRLRKGQKWYAADCSKSKEIAQAFKGGFIVIENDF